MKINKWSFIVSVINIVLAGLAIYVLKEYEHRTDIVSSQHPITDFHILEVNRSGGFKGGSSVKIAYNSKEYYTGIPITRCKTEDVEKLAYYYDAKNDAIFEESEICRVLFHPVFMFAATLVISRSAKKETMSLTDERYGEYKSVDQNRNKEKDVLGKHRIQV